MSTIPKKHNSKNICSLINELMVKLERREINKILDLFTQELEITRSELKKYCEKLIFFNPIKYGVRLEEIIWKNVYYNPISLSKRLKRDDYTPEEKYHLTCHVNSGILYYHRFISELQIRYNLDLEGIIDFPIKTKEKTENNEISQWSQIAAHRGLIYIGDLNRYHLDFSKNHEMYASAAISYYNQALLLKPDDGMPHNQIGTLASTLNKNLDSIYHYTSCLISKKPFEGTKNNLQRLYDKINTSPQNFLEKFLILTETWFFNKQRDVLLEHTKVDNFTDLNPDLMIKVIAICFSCMVRLKNSPKKSEVAGFIIDIFLKLIQNVDEQIVDGIKNFGESSDDSSRDEILKKAALINPNNLLDIITKGLHLPGIKIISDFLQDNIGILKSGCGEILSLLNLLDVVLEKIKGGVLVFDLDLIKTPLPEDFMVRNIEILQKSQKNLNWLNRNLTEKQALIVRISKLVAFRKFCDVAKTKDKIREGRILDRLWLENEVKNLEALVLEKTFSPFLVIDVNCLIKYINMIKRLIYSKKFIIIVPLVVLSALDDLKTTPKARKAIKWLERKFQRGDQFFRAQRKEETLRFFGDKNLVVQILECCHYFNKQEELTKNAVTLLIGDESDDYMNLAKLLGINVELMPHFFDEWKKIPKE